MRKCKNDHSLQPLTPHPLRLTGLSGGEGGHLFTRQAGTRLAVSARAPIEGASPLVRFPRGGHTPRDPPVQIPPSTCDQCPPNRSKPNHLGHWYLAERVGFEPTVPLPAHVLSRHADSAALAPLRAIRFQRTWHLSTRPL